MGSQPRAISASRGASILGMSAWATPFETWQNIMEERYPPRSSMVTTVPLVLSEAHFERDGYPGYNAAHGYTLPEFKEGAPLRWGLAFEDAVVSLSEEAVGENIVDREMLCTPAQLMNMETMLYDYADLDFITCHIDGHYNEHDALHEGKTTTAFAFREKWGEPGTDRIPREYQIQVQHQMLCRGAAEVIVSVLVFPEMPDQWEKMGWEIRAVPEQAIVGGYQIWKDGRFVNPIDWARPLAEMGYFHQYKIPANPKLQALMLEHYREWWTRYVIGDTPPQPRTYADVKRLTPEPCGTIIADEDLARWIAEHKQIGEESAAAAKSRDALKVKMIAHAATLAATQDEESADKWIIRDTQGKKLASYDGKTFR